MSLHQFQLVPVRVIEETHSQAMDKRIAVNDRARGDSIGNRSVNIINDMAQGMMNNEVAKTLKISAPRVCQMKRKIAGQIKQAWGDNTMAEAGNKPAWRKMLENNRR